MATGSAERTNEWVGFNPGVAPILGRLASREAVVDRPWSHNHLPENLPPGIAAALLTSVLAEIDSTGRNFLKTIARPSQVTAGLVTNCVETDNTDEIVYAYRLNRPGQSRIVLDRQPEPTDAVTLVLKRSMRLPTRMVLITAHAGESETEPWDKQLARGAPLGREASERFWSKRALIFDPAVIDFRKPHGSEPDDPVWRRILDLPELTSR